MTQTEIPELIGKILIKADSFNSNELVFETETGTRICFYHIQESDESVYINEINGNLMNLVQSPIFEASCISKTKKGKTTITYTFETSKGEVKVQWNAERCEENYNVISMIIEKSFEDFQVEDFLNGNEVDLFAVKENEVKLNFFNRTTVKIGFRKSNAFFEKCPLLEVTNISALTGYKITKTKLIKQIDKNILEIFTTAGTSCRFVWQVIRNTKTALIFDSKKL